MLDSIFSEEQVGFLRGISIHENVAFAHDFVQDLKLKKRGGNIMMKLDMSKAYDHDILLFSNGNARSVEALMKLIDNFCRLSGQKLNNAKRLMFSSLNIPDERKNDMLRTTDFSEGLFPVMYLGAPLFIGRPKIEYFVYQEEKSYPFQRLQLNALISCCAIFSGIMVSIGVKEGSQYGWEKACLPKEAGGLSILSLEDLKLSLHGKLAWKVVSENSFWCRYLRAKYGQSAKSSAVWGNISHLVDHLKQNSLWLISRGEVRIEAVCESFRIQCPSHLQGLSTKDALEVDQALLWHLLPRS
ncbi:hypothetical protein QQ045_020701 [Rhodiola kirilowii]